MGSYHNRIQLLIDAEGGRCVLDETLATQSNQNQIPIPHEKSSKPSKMHILSDFTPTIIEMHNLRVSMSSPSKSCQFEFEEA